MLPFKLFVESQTLTQKFWCKQCKYILDFSHFSECFRQITDSGFVNFSDANFLLRIFRQKLANQLISFLANKVEVLNWVFNWAASLSSDYFLSFPEWQRWLMKVGEVSLGVALSLTASLDVETLHSVFPILKNES